MAFSSGVCYTTFACRVIILFLKKNNYERVIEHEYNR